MSDKRKSQFQFQVAKSVKSDGSLSGAVEKTLKAFQQQTLHNLRRGSGTVLTTIATPEPGTYFVVLMAGPFSTIEAAKNALIESAKQPLAERMRQLGIS
jgi:hypothetical protein